METKRKSPLLTVGDLGTAVQWIICLYGVFLSAILPLIYRNNYIDINTYKYIAFSTATCAFFAAFFAYLVLRLVRLPFRRDFAGKGQIRLCVADGAMLLFLLANALACKFSENPQLSYQGLTGRKTGLQFILCLSAMYILFRYGKRALPFVKIGLTVGGALVSLLAVVNFLGFDPLKMYVNLIPAEHEMFISTIGNRNFFGAFLSVFLPIASSQFVFGEGSRAYLFLPCAFLGFAAVIAGRSDLAYAGVGAAMLALFFLSLRTSRALSRFMLLTAAAALSAFSLRLLYNAYQARSLFMYPSVSKALLTGPESMFPIILCSSLALFWLLRRAGQKTLRVLRRGAIIIVIGLFAAALGLFLFYTISGKAPVFAEDLLRFDDRFGNFRGYVWIRAVRIFKDLSPAQKLIGLGPDMFKSAMHQAYLAEMVEITGAKFDNCHNEYLQYLLTSGILGLGAYLTALAASFTALVRRVRANDTTLIPVLLALTGYAVQSFFNVNQPMTTPYVFLLMAFSQASLSPKGNPDLADVRRSVDQPLAPV